MDVLLFKNFNCRLLGCHVKSCLSKICTFETATKTSHNNNLSFFPKFGIMLIINRVNTKLNFLSGYENGGNTVIAKNPFCWFLLLLSPKPNIIFEWFLYRPNLFLQLAFRQKGKSYYSPNGCSIKRGKTSWLYYYITTLWEEIY